MNPSASIDHVALARELVRIPSVTGDYPGQLAVQDTCLDALSGTRDRLEITRSDDGRPWTLITVRGREPGVLFVCHTDTVPVGDTGEWSRDPFSGELVDDPVPHIHGRGSVDMKGGLAASVAALAFAAEEGFGAGLLMTADEEIGGLGAEQFAAEYSGTLSPRLVVLPEATGNTYSRGHRGASWFTVSAHGRAAHGSTPDKGVNAIRVLSDAVISRIDDIPRRSDDYLGEDTVNLGTIHGGLAPNMVPGHAELSLDCRTVSGGGHIAEYLSGLAESVSCTEKLSRPPLQPRPVPDAMDRFRDVGPVPYFTDGAMIQHVVGDAPLVVWGPGEDDQMHTVDERMLVSSLDDAVENYRGVVEALGR